MRQDVKWGGGDRGRAQAERLTRKKRMPRSRPVLVRIVCMTTRFGTAVPLLGIIALALVLAELLLRVVGFSHPVFAQADSVTGFAHIPGARGWYAAEGRGYVRINSDGWRDKERPFQKPAGVTRIAILGDSYMEAMQVSEDSAFPSLLEHNLNRTLPGRYDVLNLGVSGFGTAQELLVLRHSAFAYSPDAVILAFTTGNDVSDNSRAIRRLDYVPYFRFVDERLVLDSSFRTSRGFLARRSWRARVPAFLVQHSRVAQLVRAAKIFARNARRPAQSRVDPEVYLNPPPDSLWAEAWNVTERLVALINVECRARHIPFYVITLSNPEQVTPDAARQRALAAELGVPDLFQPERRLEQAGIRHRFPVLTLAPFLASQAIATQQYYHGFGKYRNRGHWNERGHRAAATLASAWLAERLLRAGDEE